MNRILLVISGFIVIASIAMGTSILYGGLAVAASDINDALCDPGGSGVGTSYCNEVNEPENKDQSATSNVLVGPNGIITEIINALSYVVGIIALIMIIVGGFMYIFSGGNSESAGRATKTILYAVIGLIIALSAQVIVIFVLSRLD